MDALKMTFTELRYFNRLAKDAEKLEKELYER